MRVDEFVLKHVNFISGRIKLANAQSRNLTDATEESHIEISEDEIEPINKIITASSTTNSCPVCSNGDKPTGAHKCYICNKAVHAIDGMFRACK